MDQPWLRASIKITGGKESAYYTVSKSQFVIILNTFL